MASSSTHVATESQDRYYLFYHGSNVAGFEMEITDPNHGDYLLTVPVSMSTEDMKKYLSAVHSSNRIIMATKAKFDPNQTLKSQLVFFKVHQVCLDYILRLADSSQTPPQGENIDDYIDCIYAYEDILHGIARIKALGSKAPHPISENNPDFTRLAIDSWSTTLNPLNPHVHDYVMKEVKKEASKKARAAS